MKPPLILALDIGTSSVRAAVYDSSGEVLPKTFVKNERTLTATDDGGAEIDAAEAFAQIEKAIDDVLKKAAKIKGEIEYVAVSSFWHSLVGIDAKGKPTTKVFGWADTRSRDYVSELRKKFNQTEIHNRTGARFHSSFWTAKLFWLRKEFPDVFKKTDKWLSFSDFVALKFFGTPSSRRQSADTPKKSSGNINTIFTSVSMASATGIFDIRQNVWDTELIKFLKVKKTNLPEIVAEDSQTFQLNKKYANRWEKLKNANGFRQSATARQTISARAV